MAERPAAADPHIVARTIASVTAALGAAGLFFLWTGAYSALTQGRLVESLVGRLDREVAEVHADLRAKIVSGEPLDDALGLTATRVGRMADSLRSVNASPTTTETFAAFAGALLNGGGNDRSRCRPGHPGA
jgi:hypothetical protein